MPCVFLSLNFKLQTNLNKPPAWATTKDNKMSMRKLTGEAAILAAATPRRGSLLYKPAQLFAPIAGAIAVAASTTLTAFADRTVSSAYTLTADEDWTGDGKITIASGVTVNLAGHTLTVAGLDGGGTITNIVTGFTNLATDTSKASCSDGITSVDTSATAGRAFENTNRVIVKNINSYWPFSVTYDFGEAKVINAYSITASSANNYYNVRGP